MAFIVSLVFFENFIVLQLSVITLTSYFMVLYMLKTKPFEEESVNKFEIVNEVVIKFLCYLLWSFTDFIWDGKLKF